MSNISFLAALLVNFVYARNSWMRRVLHEPPQNALCLLRLSNGGL